MTAKPNLNILQYNARKSRETVMISFLQDKRVKEFDILAIQEPWHNTYIPTTYNPRESCFYLAFPTQDTSRVCFYINKKINPNTWEASFPTGDTGTLQIWKDDTRSSTALTIHNIYNPSESYSSRKEGSLTSVRRMLSAGSPQICLGDFNLHHPYWSGPARPTQHRAADTLIDLMESANMTLTIPPGTITWEARDAYSTIDLVFASEELINQVIRCETRRDLDH